MLIFYYHPLTCSLGVQIALLESGAIHEQVKVDLMGDRTEYQKVNSLGTVPALRTDEGVLTESVAIMTWLALAYPQAQLLPKDAFGFASGVSFLTWLSATPHIVRRQFKFPGRYTNDAAAYAAVQQSGSQQFMACLLHIDKLLAGRNYILGGDSPSGCDYQLMAYANWCATDGISTSDLPSFERWRGQMLQRPRVQEALQSIGSLLVK